jgi:hypothetical protein
MNKKELDHRQYLKIKDTPEYKERNARGTRKWAQAHPEQWAARDRGDGAGVEYRVTLKIEVLSHYGPQGKLQCAWPDCSVTDVDMLSLDHVNNDGASDRKNKSRGGGGNTTYRRVRAAGYPEGFQTLCHNHQWKKELMRRREKRESNG